jgi:hypothetical protein
VHPIETFSESCQAELLCMQSRLPLFEERAANLMSEKVILSLKSVEDKVQKAYARDSSHN